jgi:spermidine/putrescine transport system permease protein
VTASPGASESKAGRYRLARHAGRAAALQVLAVPAYAWTVLFFLLPLTILVVYSFGEIDILTYKVHFGWTFRHYTDLTQSLYRDTVFRSLQLSFGATAACLVIGLPVAYFISLQRRVVEYLLLTAVIVPFWTSFIVRTYAWIDVLGQGSPVAHGASWLGLKRTGLLYNNTAVVIGIVANYLPLMILALYVGFKRIDPSLRDAARDLGAPGHRAFRRVILPLATPGVIAGCLLVAVPAAGEYVIPAILGGGKTLMFGNIVADQFLTVGDYPFGSALAVSVMALLTILILALRAASASIGDEGGD